MTVAILNFQDGGHKMPESFGAGLRMIARTLKSIWKKFGAFIRRVPIFLKFGSKLLGYHKMNVAQYANDHSIQETFLHFGINKSLVTRWRIGRIPL